MALFDKIYKAKYSAKNYKKYCKDANSTFVYTSVYLSYNENLDDLPKFVQNVHYITLFLADTLNSSLFFKTVIYQKGTYKFSLCANNFYRIFINSVYNHIYSY